MSDKIEQMQGNVLTNATKHKETIVHKRFRQKLSSSGVRRETKKIFFFFFFFFLVESACVLLFLCVSSHW